MQGVVTWCPLSCHGHVWHSCHCRHSRLSCHGAESDVMWYTDVVVGMKVKPKTFHRPWVSIRASGGTADQTYYWLYHIQTVHTSLALKYLWSYKQILLTPNYWSPCIQIVHFTRTQNHFHSDTLFDCLESSPSRIILLIPILEYVMYGLALWPVYNKYCGHCSANILLTAN